MQLKCYHANTHQAEEVIKNSCISTVARIAIKLQTCIECTSNANFEHSPKCCIFGIRNITKKSPDIYS